MNVIVMKDKKTGIVVGVIEQPAEHARVSKGQILAKYAGSHGLDPTKADEIFDAIACPVVPWAQIETVFDGIDAKPHFRVIEYSSGYAVRHIASNQEHWMSDGVDAVFDENGEAMTPGTEIMRQSWENMLNATKDDTYEAYFPKLRRR